MGADPLASLPSNPADNKGPLVAGVIGAFLGLTWLSMALRLYVRNFIQHGARWDDYLMYLATAFFTAMSGVIFWGVHMGMGRHIRDLSKEDITKSILAWYICEILYAFCITTVKVSIGLFLLRIAVMRVHRLIIIAVTTVNVILGVVFLGFIIFQCHPISYFWFRALNDSRPGHCTNTIAPLNLVYIQSALSVTIDLTFAILPVFMVRDLQMPPRTKVLIAIILGMGTIGAAALLIRLPYLIHLGANLDFLYATTNVAIWSAVEPGMVIVAGSLATLRPLVLALSGKRSRRTSGVQNQFSEHRPYQSHSRRPGSEERVLGASGMGGVGGRSLTLESRRSDETGVSLEKLDLENGRVVSMLTVLKAGPEEMPVKQNAVMVHDRDLETGYVEDLESENDRVEDPEDAVDIVASTARSSTDASSLTRSSSVASSSRSSSETIPHHGLSTTFEP